MRIGFIGLGVMGLPMARHLVAAGHELTVASRSPGPVALAVADGAREADDPAAVAHASEVVVLCVPDSPDVEAVVGALLPGLVPGSVVVDCSTIDPEVERSQHARVRAAGGQYLDAPVSGGSAGAVAGTLTVMVGGAAEVLERARPALEPFAGRIVHVGGAGMGQVVKLCNNLAYAASMLAAAEAFALAGQAGADPAKAYEVFTHSSADSTAISRGAPVPGLVPGAPASNGWAPGFMASLMAKDLDLALALGRRTGVELRTTPLVRALLAEVLARGLGRQDFSVLATLVGGAGS